MSDPSNYYNVVQTEASQLRLSAVNPFTYANITTSAQTVVKSAPGTLHGIAANSNNISAIKIYDNTVSGGNVIGTLPTSALAAGPFYQFDTNFATGLVISSGSSNTDLTVSYV